MWPVDAEGNVYVADLHQFEDDKGFPDAMTRVIKLAAGSDTPAVLPQFVHAGLMGRIPREPSGSRMPDDQLVKLAVGSGTQTVLPLPDLGGRGDVMAVDTADNVCGANGGAVYSDGGCCIAVHVVKSAAGSNAPTVLPFKPVNDIGWMAVDTFGDVYVGDFDRNRVPKLAAGADTPTVLPFTNLHGVADVAVDAAGSVYVVDGDHNRVLKLAAGSDAPTVLPFAGINQPIRVAVDSSGNVYVVDGGNHRVLKLGAD